jgi:hypothetical protein
VDVKLAVPPGGGLVKRTHAVRYNSADVRTFPPGLFLIILIYVTLDLSFAWMPGAFVFDPADSVEGVQMNRAEDVVRVVTPVRAEKATALLEPAFTVRRPIVPRSSVPLLLFRVSTGERAAPPDAPASSEDPH